MIDAAPPRQRMLPKQALLAPVAMLAAGAVWAAPPPPAPSPEHLASPIEGYDLRSPFQLWRYWVEAQKGAVADRLLARADEVEGFAAMGKPFLRLKKSNDFGHFMSGEVRSYCRPKLPHGFIEGSCHYRLRRVYVPGDAGGWDDNPVAQWTRDNFDPAKLVAHFKALGLPPDTDWWRVDRERMFSALPSPVEILTASATMVRLDSRDCDPFGAAIAEMDTKRLSWRTDVWTVGRDVQPVYPGPHSVVPVWSLDIGTPRGGFVTIEGSGKDFHAIVGPVLDAADAFEKAGKHRITGGG